MNEQLSELGSRRGSGGTVVLGALLTLLLIPINVARHPESIEGSGRTMLQVVSLLCACAAAGTGAWRQRKSKPAAALAAGAHAGLLLGAVAIANHVIELFAPPANRITQFVFGAGPVLLMIALFAMAGSVARERTRSVFLGVLAGMWCAVLALLILLSFAFTSNLLFEPRRVSVYKMRLLPSA